MRAAVKDCGMRVISDIDRIVAGERGGGGGAIQRSIL